MMHTIHAHGASELSAPEPANTYSPSAIGFLESLLPRARAMANGFRLQTGAATGNDLVGPLPAILGGGDQPHQTSKQSAKSEKAAAHIAKETETTCHEQMEQSNEPPKSRPVPEQTPRKSRRQSQDEEELLKLMKDAQKRGCVRVTTDKDRCKYEQNVHWQERAEMKLLFDTIRAGQAAGYIQMLRRGSTEHILLPGGVCMKFKKPSTASQ